MAEFTSNNTLSSIGNYRILAFEDPFVNIAAITGFEDCIEGENPPSVVVEKEFRWSTDDVSYSLWMPLTEENLAALPLPEVTEENCCDPMNFYIQLRYTLISLPDESVTPPIPPLPDGTDITPIVTICSFDLITTPAFPEEPITPVHLSCSDEFTNPTFTLKNNIPTPGVDPLTKENDPNIPFNPYAAINKGTGIYRTLAMDVTGKFGHEVTWYRVEPQKRSKDVILKEYTINNVFESGKVKVLVPDNEFPDNKFNFNPFGIDFEQPFEVHISIDFWNSIFGEDTIPRKRDILDFGLLNRLYEIQGVYPFRDFMQQILYYKAYLVKYQPRTNTIFQDPVLEEEIDDISISTEEIFGEEKLEEERQITNPDQLNPITFASDSMREIINLNLEIAEYDFMNDWTLISENFYNLESLWTPISELASPAAKQETAIQYWEPVTMAEDQSRSFTFWMNIPIANEDDFTEFSVTTAAKLPGDLLEIRLTAPHEYAIGDLILLTTNGTERDREGFFEIVSIGGSPADKIVVEDKTPTLALSSTSGWKVKKSNVRAIVDGMPATEGWKLDLNYNTIGSENRAELVLNVNDKEFRSFLPINSLESEDLNKWYGVVVNMSNEFQQLAFYVWEMIADMSNALPQTSDLALVHKDVQTFTPETFELSDKYKLIGSPIRLTNIRLFDAMIPEDDQVEVLNHNLVQDAQRAQIIDNAKKPLRLPRIARNR